MKTVLSGIQPTGNLHLGNYLGSIANWIDLQETHKCIFGVMNLHAITLPQDPKALHQNVLDAASVYLACGLDPKKSTIFVQSEVEQHAELAWVLGCLTPMGWLNRMTQFKDKAKIVEEYSGLIGALHDRLEVSLHIIQVEQNSKAGELLKLEEEIKNYGIEIEEEFTDLEGKSENELEEELKNLQNTNKKLLEKQHDLLKEVIKIRGELIDKIRETHNKAAVVIEEYEEKKKKAENQIKAALGLYAYPTLMASDILLYRADVVPVGEDQKQHLELTRDIAGAFNRRFGVEYFKLPEPMIVKEVKRIMSLQDGTKKMSKSDESDLSRINLNDDADLILKKVKKAKTDSLPTITFDEARPEIFNLLNIFSAASNKSPQDLAKEYETAGNGKFKTDLAESLIEKLRPIQENLRRFKQDQSYVRQVLDQGREQARAIAAQTKKEVFEIVGL